MIFENVPKIIDNVAVIYDKYSDENGNRKK